MKKILKSISLVFVALFLLGSCEEVKEILPVPSMTATVDGEAWTSIFRATVLFESNNMITITGTPEASKEVDKAIIVSINATEVGTYEQAPLTNPIGDCNILYKKTANATTGSADYYLSTTATVTITKIDKEKKQISGTFSGSLLSTGANEVIISNGKFENLNYQVQQ